MAGGSSPGRGEVCGVELHVPVGQQDGPHPSHTQQALAHAAAELEHWL